MSIKTHAGSKQKGRRNLDPTQKKLELEYKDPRRVKAICLSWRVVSVEFLLSNEDAQSSIRGFKAQSVCQGKRKWVIGVKYFNVLCTGGTYELLIYFSKKKTD